MKTGYNLSRFACRRESGEPLAKGGGVCYNETSEIRAVQPPGQLPQ